jgi:hypothetical protein
VCDDAHVSATVHGSLPCEVELADSSGTLTWARWLAGALALARRQFHRVPSTGGIPAGYKRRRNLMTRLDRAGL